MAERPDGFDRRVFLGASASALTALPGLALAQAESGTGSAAGARMSGAAAAVRPSAVIAGFVVNFDLKTLPPVALERARIAFIDTVGVMLAGSRMPASDIIAAMIAEEAAAPVAAIVGRGARTSPQLAALANGVASHAMDYDFTFGIGQAAASVIPALLPLAEKNGASAAELLAAFVVGFEVTSRFARAHPTHSAIGGWHGTGTIGTLAAAAACARLLRVPAASVPDIIGIAASTASGVSSNFGTMTKPLHAGHAARDGMVAALLGSRGLTASATALEGHSGFFENFARGLDWSLAPFEDLGRVVDLAERGFTLKRYPCGGHSHCTVDAALEIHEALGARVLEIASVTVGLSKNSAQRISDAYPKTVENAKFSAPYITAYTLLKGAPLLAAFTEQAIEDKAVQAFSGRIKKQVDPEFADTIEVNPGRVTVTLNDGTRIERMKRYAIGSVRVPMSAAQIREKFLACAEPVVGAATADKIHGLLSTLGTQESLRDFWPLLRTASSQR